MVNVMLETSDSYSSVFVLMFQDSKSAFLIASDLEFWIGVNEYL